MRVHLALSLSFRVSPLYLDKLVPGSDSYVVPDMMPAPGSPGINRAWRFHNILRSVAWSKGGVVKNRAPFDDHHDPDAFLALLDEAASRNVERPSGYGDLFHQTYWSPALSGAARRTLTFEVPGAWQEMTVLPGKYLGTWRRYDIRSAYLWSMAQGLPNPKSFRWSEKFGRRDGLYCCRVAPHPTAPYPYRVGGDLPVTRQEIDTYGLSVERIHYGVTWSNPWDIDPMMKAVTSWSCWKQVGRSFWGRYASLGKVQCETYKSGALNKAWELPNRFVNPVWAHLILGRVRLRLFDVARTMPTARVYVDSVVVSGELPTGDALGDWKLEAEFHGLDIRHLNIYRSIAAHQRAA